MKRIATILILLSLSLPANAGYGWRQDDAKLRKEVYAHFERQDKAFRNIDKSIKQLIKTNKELRDRIKKLEERQCKDVE